MIHKIMYEQGNSHADNDSLAFFSFSFFFFFFGGGGGGGGGEFQGNTS